MSTQVEVKTQKKKSYNFRFGREFDNEKATFTFRRTPYANFWISGIIEEIFAKGFKATIPNTEEEHKWNDKMWKDLRPMWNDVLRGIKFQRGLGKSMFSIMQDDEDSEKLLLRSFARHQYNIGYTKSFNIESVDAIERIGGITANTINHQWKKEDAKDGLFELIIKDTEVKGTGISELEAIWDLLFGLAINEEHAVLYAIRNGGGLPVAMVPMALMAQDGFMDTFMEGMSKMGDLNTVMVIPTGDDANFKGVEFDVVQSDQMDFLAVRDLLLGGLAAATGVAREIWLGSELGMKSAETNRDAFYTLKQNLQFMYEELFRWIVDTLNVKYKWFGTNTEYDIKYIVEKVQDETEEVALLKTKIEIASMAGFNVDMSELASTLGLTLVEKEIDPLGINGDGEEEEEEDEEVVDEEEIIDDESTD